MTRHLLTKALLVVALVCGVAQAGIWMELNGAPTQVTEHGQPGWEYWYDVRVTDSIAPTQLRFGGFDATELLNIDGGTLYERWDSTAAGYPFYGSGGPGDYPSYRLKDGPDEWILSGHPWQMINPTHAPTEYAGVYSNSMYAGSTSEEGIQFWYAINSGYRTGLFMTVRLVHPLGPGLINYSICTWTWDHWETPIIGPGATPGDFDLDGDVDDIDIDALCDFIRGGLPYDSLYDVSGPGEDGVPDGFVDVNDLDYHVHALVETSIGNGTEYGDFNLDGVIDTTDLTRLATNYGADDWMWDDGNANRYIDTDIDNTDLTILATYYGFGEPDVIPEPATLFVMGCGAVGLLRRRRQTRIA